MDFDPTSNVIVIVTIVDRKNDDSRFDGADAIMARARIGRNKWVEHKGSNTNGVLIDVFTFQFVKKLALIAMERQWVVDGRRQSKKE